MIKGAILTQLKLVSLILSIVLLVVVLPKPMMALEVNPFVEKWGTNLYTYPGVEPDFCTLVMPVTADVMGDSWHEIFLSLGYDHSIGDDGIVFCLDGHTGEVIWSYFSPYFGSHTCLELFDLDNDGDLELLATGYHHVVAFHAENGDILWEFTRMGNRQDKPAVILEEDGMVYVFTVSHQGDDGIGLQKRLGATGVVVAEVPGPLHPCHGGLSCEDLDGDGEFELISTDRDFGTGHGGVQCYDTDLNLIWSQPSVQCSSHCANIVDVNGDGVFDVVVMEEGDGSAGICVVDGVDGSQMEGKWSENLGLYSHYTPTIYDIDQDGHLELITARDLSGGSPTSIWDLETWSLDTELWRQDGFGLCKPPQIANVMGNSDMEMIFVTHAGFEIYDKNYELAAYQNDGYDGRSDRIVIQDIDDDGLNEIIAVMHSTGTGYMTYAFIQCLDTQGTALNPQARSNNFLYSLRRNGVSIYVPPLEGGEGSNDAPIAYDDSYGTEINTELNIDLPGVLSNDVDYDGPDSLSAELAGDVSDGLLTFYEDGSFVYVPDLDFVGDDSFEYRAWDGELFSNIATVCLSITPVIDTIPPDISEIHMVTSNPVDTEIGFGWENFTCVVTDNVAVDDVYIQITYPDETMDYFPMIKIMSTNNYYFKTTLTTHGNYSYLIWADDTSGNDEISGDFDFALLSNWDVNMDGKCTVFDQVLVSNYYGQTGYPGWIREDVDNNGIIGVYDLVVVSNHYGEFWWT